MGYSLELQMLQILELNNKFSEALRLKNKLISYMAHLLIDGGEGWLLI